MKKLGFIIPWYSEKIPGGAEMELRGLTTHLHQSGIELEILTTCVKEFSADWSVNHYRAGRSTVHGFTLRRFKARKRNVRAFDAVNFKLLNSIPITEADQETYVREMVNSPDLYEYMAKHKDEYSLFVFIPYMFGTTYYGMQVCPEKSVLIPCFHDEAYIYMDIYKPVIEKIAGIIYHALPEYDLANRVFELGNVKQAVLGEGVYTDLTSDGAAFRRKFGIDGDFILYAGRKDKGKMVHILLKYFEEYKKRRSSPLKLVLIGGGDIDIPKSLLADGSIIDLGFVSVQDKYDAQAAALALCQPSQFESFSLVIMESWLNRRPVMVNAKCTITRSFASLTNGGLYFDNYFEFEGALDYLISHPDIASQMGENGRNYVISNFAWDVIVEKYMRFFNDIAGEG
ncbi:MAG: glycosyltransferase family 4 protein [Clostridia bacterium]|nr:glycosyltransferase family 4 protein [Clostridia bacterium]